MSLEEEIIRAERSMTLQERNAYEQILEREIIKIKRRLLKL